MSNNAISDTIAAIATPRGIGGIGIIRVSGENAKMVLDRIFSPYRKDTEITPGRLVLGRLLDNNGDFIDEGFAVLFTGPHSYTGEDVVEFQCHGGSLVQKAILQAVMKTGIRLAVPGEFTLRAFLNGRIDLSQSEAVLDIIEAKTAKGLSLAGKQLEGKLSGKINELEEKILDLLAEISAAADFPEDITPMPRDELTEKLSNVQNIVATLLRSAGEGRIYREGLSVVLTGAVNVGKSSILNALLEEERAIVTSLPGTTRDVIEEYFNLEGIPLLISDTAGLREAVDEAEVIGIDKSKAKIAAARVILVVIDAQIGLDQEAEKLILDHGEQPLLVVINKNDLTSDEEVIKKIGKISPGNRLVSVSARTGQGINELKRALVELVLGDCQKEEGGPFVTNGRHEQALIRAQEALAAASETVEKGLPEDLTAVDLTAAWQALGEITGNTASQDILDNIFSRFCLGK